MQFSRDHITPLVYLLMEENIVLSDRDIKAHRFLLGCGKAIVERCKVRKFLDRIKFGPMDADKVTVLFHPKITNSFPSNTD